MSEVSPQMEPEQPGDPSWRQRFRTAHRRLVQFFYNIYVEIAVISFIAATAAKVFKLQLPSLPAVLFGLDLHDWRFSFFLVGYVAASVAFIGGFVIAGRLFLKAWQHKGEYPSIGAFSNIRNVFVSMQSSRQYYELYAAQAGLRACLIFSVVVAAMASLNSFTEPPHVHFLVVACNGLHILLSVGYLVTCLLLHRGDRRLLRKTQTGGSSAGQDIDYSVTRIFWISTWIDLIYIAIVVGTTVLPSRPFHFGFMIPIVAVWMFRGKQANGIFLLIIACLAIHATALILVGLNSTAAVDLNLVGWGGLIPAGEFILNAAFWFSIGLLLTLFRDSQYQLKEAVATSDIIRNGLETLAEQEGLAVFAKDTNRHFIFANSIFRQKLAKFLKQMPSPPSKLEQLLKEKKISWEQFLKEKTVPWWAIKYKSDDDIGLTEKDFPEYKASDLAVLESVKEEDGHYQKSEPSFSDQGKVIWTRKELLRDPRDASRKLGLIGYVVDGLPIEFHQIQLPFYASLKDEQGHVLWANAMHLAKLAPAIQRLYRDQYNKDEVDKISTAAQLRKLNNGDGPFDWQLYGQTAGRDYRALDQQIMDLARRYGQTEKFNEEMEAMIASRNLPRRIGRTHKYPLNGWLEYHRFPKQSILNGPKAANAGNEEQVREGEIAQLEEEGVWVEVWKMPRWERRIVENEITHVVKGVLVFFEDVHASYLRERIFWHAVNKHLMHVSVASTIMLEAVPSEQAELANRLGSCLSIGEIVRRMLFAFQEFVDGRQFRLSDKPNIGSDALENLLRTVEAGFPRRIKLDLDLGDFVCERRGEDLFCIVLALVVRASEATQKFCEDQIVLPPVSVIIKETIDQFRVVITDRAIPHADQQNIHSSNNPIGWAHVSEKYIPGEGYYIATKLTARLWEEWARITKKQPPNSVFRSEPFPDDCAGSVVSLELPLAVFRKTPTNISSPPPSSPPGS